MDVVQCQRAVDSLTNSDDLNEYLSNMHMISVNKYTDAPVADNRGATSNGNIGHARTLLVRCVHSSDASGHPAHAATTTSPHNGRAFFQDPPPSVTLVADRLTGSEDVVQALRHELQHATDLLVHGMDMGSCGGLACSEVRAAGMAECHGLGSVRRRRACVLDKARMSTGMVFPGVGAACVEAVFPLCFDTPSSVDPTRSPAYRALIDAEVRSLQ